MFRIDGPGATNDNKFTEGDPANGTRATVVTDEWLNSVQEEIANAIEASGLELSKEDQSQLSTLFGMRVIRASSVAEIGGYSVPIGFQFSLSAGGRSGMFDVISGDFSEELTNDPLNGVYVALADDPDALTKVAKRRFTGDPRADWFGAVGDLDLSDYSGTDDTAAIQAAINWASNNGYIFVQLEPKGYKYSNLWFNYDSVNNPGFANDPSVNTRDQGLIVLRGSGGVLDKGAIENNVRRGTVIYSDSSDHEASIIADGTSAGGDNAARGVRLEYLVAISNNSTKVVDFTRAPQRSGGKFVMVRQLGSGGGWSHLDLWNASYESVFIEGAGKTVSLGEGFYCRNENLGAGFLNLDTVNVNGFKKCVVLGHLTRSAANRLHGINARNVQGGDGEVGLTIGAGVGASQFFVHTENNEIGLHCMNNARDSSIRHTCSGNTVNDAIFGSTVADENLLNRIEYTGQLLLSNAPSMIRIHSGDNIGELVINTPDLQGDGTNLAIELDDVDYKNLSIIRPAFVNVANDINFPDRVTRLQYEDGGCLESMGFRRFRYSEDTINVQTLTGVTTLNRFSETIQLLDPDGTNRAVNLAGQEGKVFNIANTGSSGDLVVRRADNSDLIKTVTPGTHTFFWNAGGIWFAGNISNSMA